MIKACIFDLDGTLADTLVSIAYSANRALEKLNYAPFPVEKYRWFAGDGAAELLRRTLVERGDDQCRHFEELQKAYQESFGENCMYQVKPYEGICSMLEELKKDGIRVAVLSNKPHAQAVRVVEELFGKDYFDIVQGQTAEVPRKPSPQGAFRIAGMLDVKPEECLYVGDTDTDMETGKAAGMYTVGVLWGFRDRAELEEHQADMVIIHPDEIVKAARKVD